MFRLVMAAAFLLPDVAAARVVHMNSCVMTIGDFCPVETIGGTIAVILLLGFSGFPARYVLRRHFQRRFSADPDYRPDGFSLFFYRNAGLLTIFAAVGAIGFVVAQFS